MTTTMLSATRSHVALRRVGWALGAAALLVLAARLDLFGAWYLWVFLLAPDLPLLAGYGPGLAPRHIHPRAVRGYNATHRLAGPVLLVLVPGLAPAALAWASHIAIDRAFGYGLRSPDGSIRP